MLSHLKLPNHSGEFVRKCGGWSRYHDYCDREGLAKKITVKFQKKTRNGVTLRWTETRLTPLPRQVYGIKGRKIGRNEPCSCGSEKKFKRCCLR